MQLTRDMIAPGPLAVAVSGGGDSMALMHLVHDLALSAPVHIVTVDHGLRDVSAEIALVAEAAQAMDLPHHVLRWEWSGQGNLQAAARAGRRAVIAEWAASLGITQVLLGHTRDDQAETVLMRLARGSGVDGLAGMAAEDQSYGLRWLRPLLEVSRADLRAVLTERGQTWAEDPSNEDPRFDRVKARQMAETLAELGLTPDRLIQTADHMAAARGTLTRAAAEFAAQHVREDRGDLLIPPVDLSQAEDTPRRVLATAIGWIGGQGYRPRFAALCAAWQGAHSAPTTLGGTLMRPEGRMIRLSREPAAATARAEITEGTAVWDGRWRVSGPEGAEVRALGEEGLAQQPNWRGPGLPRSSLLSSPSLWRGARLIAAPLAGNGPGSAETAPDFQSLFDSR